MIYTSQPAFVLHARLWRETSLLVEVLSAEYGRVGLLARGVQGGKKHALRAALQPLQSICFDAVQRGELAQLRSAEAQDIAPMLHGQAAMVGFYLNELTLRLAPRHDPLPEVFLAYARTRTALLQGQSMAWPLRCYERDLLEALGVGVVSDTDNMGAPIDPAARYSLDAEHGPVRSRSHDRASTVTGRGLLALAADSAPSDAEDLASLRRALRPVLLHHLGGRGLKSWEMLGDLGRLVPPETQKQP